MFSPSVKQKSEEKNNCTHMRNYLLTKKKERKKYITSYPIKVGEKIYYINTFCIKIVTAWQFDL